MAIGGVIAGPPAPRQGSQGVLSLLPARALHVGVFADAARAILRHNVAAFVPGPLWAVLLARWAALPRVERAA